jgi:hypothetical protein
MNIKLSLCLFTTTLLLSGWNQPYAGTQPQFANTELLIHTRTAQLSQHCMTKWQQFHATSPYAQAGKISHFQQGIQRLCQARAELFFEGYAIAPTLKAAEQANNHQLLFLPSVAAVKQQMRSLLAHEPLI